MPSPAANRPTSSCSLPTYSCSSSCAFSAARSITRCARWLYCGSLDCLLPLSSQLFSSVFISSRLLCNLCSSFLPVQSCIVKRPHKICSVPICSLPQSKALVVASSSTLAAASLKPSRVTLFLGLRPAPFSISSKKRLAPSGVRGISPIPIGR